LAHWREGYQPLMGVRGTSPLASAQDERRVTGCGASARSWPLCTGPSYEQLGLVGRRVFLVMELDSATRFCT
jgi:hypothetical protein